MRRIVWIGLFLYGALFWFLAGCGVRYLWLHLVNKACA